MNCNKSCVCHSNGTITGTVTTWVIKTGTDTTNVFKSNTTEYNWNTNASTDVTWTGVATTTVSTNDKCEGCGCSKFHYYW